MGKLSSSPLESVMMAKTRVLTSTSIEQHSKHSIPCSPLRARRIVRLMTVQTPETLIDQLELRATSDSARECERCLRTRGQRNAMRMYVLIMAAQTAKVVDTDLSMNVSCFGAVSTTHL